MPAARKKRKSSLRAATQTSRPAAPSFFERHEARIILVLCILAGLRVLVFSAGFPFFNNVDEGAHFELICKYAEGHIPTCLESYSEEAGRRITLAFTAEYLGLQGMTPRTVPLPLWLSPKYETPEALERCMPYMRKKINHESTQPPLYYAAMVPWFKLGKLLGLDGGHLLYWLRLIDVPIYMVLVWLCYLFVKRFYARDMFLRFGAPLLLVVFPQDVFYSINNDVFTPLLFGASLYCLMDIYLAQSKSYRFHILTGLAVAATFLTKFTNLPVLIVLGIIMLLTIVKVRKEGRLSRELPKIGALCFAAAVPIALWLVRNHLVLGDITGTAAKLTWLGWAEKPLHAMWHHPIFTPAGMAYFWIGLMKTFWRGEFVWFNAPVASNGVDLFYVWSTAAFLLASLVGLWAYRKKNPGAEGFVSVMGFCVFVLSAGFLGFLSTLYDYGRCVYPSRLDPYLTSGRLMSGALIPFVVLYLKGLQTILSEIGLARARWAVLSGVALLILISEIVISEAPFRSFYNWYHMF